MAIGGGGLSAGVGSYFKTFSPHTKIIGVEPKGAPSMYEALKAGQPVTLENIERFVDGAAVKIEVVFQEFSMHLHCQVGFSFISWYYTLRHCCFHLAPKQVI